MDALLITSSDSNSVIYERYYRRKNQFPITEIINHPSDFGFRVFDKNLVACYYCENDVKLISLLSHTCIVSSAIDFLGSLSDCLAAYFMQDLSAQLLKDNLITVMLIFEEMIDFGLPSLVNTDALKLIIPLKTDFIKNLTSFKGYVVSDFINYITSTKSKQYGAGIGNGSGVGKGSGMLGTGSSNWWRRGDVKYLFNEITANVIESFNCTVNSKKDILSCHLTGNIDICSKISGVPRVQLILSNPFVLGNTPMISMHPSVDYDIWKSDRVIKFIPTDTYFNLCRYSIIPKTNILPPILINGTFMNAKSSTVYDSSSSFKNQSVNHPNNGTNANGVKEMNVSPTILYTPKETFIHFHLTLKPNQNFHCMAQTCMEKTPDLKITNIKVTVPLPQCTCAFSFTSVSHGVAKYLPNHQKLTWYLPELHLNSEKICTFEGTLKLIDINQKSTGFISWLAQANFTILDWPASSLNIDSIDIIGQKPSFAPKNIFYRTNAGSVIFYL